MSVSAGTIRPRITVPPFTRGRPATSDVSTFDRDYWIRHCEGYRVDGGGGRIGFVNEVRDVRGAVVLRVRLGMLGRTIVDVPAAEIAFIVPRSQQIWLRSQAER